MGLLARTLHYDTYLTNIQSCSVTGRNQKSETNLSLQKKHFLKNGFKGEFSYTS